MEDDLVKLEAVFGKVTPVEAQYEVYASAKIYPHAIRVFIPSVPYKKKLPFFEEHVDEYDNVVEDWPTQVNLSNEVKEDNIERSLRRTRTLIADYVLCNEFELFATFTFDPKKSDRLNPDAVKLQMANWLRNQRKRTGRFQYLIVPEFHKDGQALHFHALFMGYGGELVNAGRSHNGRQVYHFKSYTLGFNSAVKIDDVAKVSSYVRKYITKDMPQFRDKRRFWTSLNLERPRIIDNPDNLADFGTPVWISENEYGWTLYFERRDSGEEVQGS
jgi:hypothetical protein